MCLFLIEIPFVSVSNSVIVSLLRACDVLNVAHDSLPIVSVSETHKTSF